MPGRLIIGLGYRKESGKDTAADLLVSKYRFTKLAFAGKLKQTAAVLFGLTEDQMSDPVLKHTMDPRWGMTPREILQKLGAGMREVFYPDIWIDLLEKDLDALPKDRDVVISDCRYLNEIQFIKDRGGLCWKVHRPSLTYQDAHSSETALDGYDGWDRTLHNDGSKEAFQELVSALAMGLGCREL